MANPFSKGWRYLMALFGAKIDEYADPKVQIQQAIEDAQRQHQALVQQAAAVIGNQRQLEMKLSRQMSEVEKLQGMARQALVLADRARAGGDEAEAQKYESTATTLATQLVSGEQSMEDLKTLHDQALGRPVRPARRSRTTRWCSSSASPSAPACSASSSRPRCRRRSPSRWSRCRRSPRPGNTPSLDEVRDKIEQRYANAMGRAELASNSVEGRMLEVQKSSLDMAGTSRLEQIRASMAGEQARRLAGPAGRRGGRCARPPTRPASPGSTRSGPA